MDESAHGIILRTRPLTETSLIVHWLTPEHGRIATVAKGARRPKSQYHGKLDLFFSADFNFTRSRRSDLHNLREVRLRETNAELRRSLHKLEQLSYFTNLIEQTTESDTPIPETHELFVNVVKHLRTHDPHPRLVFAFELKHLTDLGLAPDLESSKLKKSAAELVETLVSADWTQIAELKTDATTAREIQQFLHGFLIYHIERLPKGRATALAQAAT